MSFTWQHTFGPEADPIGTAMAKVFTPDSIVDGPDALRTLRALQVGSYLCVQNLADPTYGNKVVVTPTEKGLASSGGVSVNITTDFASTAFATADHFRAATALARTWECLDFGFWAGAPAGVEPSMVTTIDAGPPIAMVGATDLLYPGGRLRTPPLISGLTLPASVGIAIVVGASACILFAAERTYEYAVSALKQNADTKNLAAQQSALMHVVDAHRAAEDAAGHALPMTPVESTAIDAITATQKEYIDKVSAKLAEPPPSILPTGASLVSGLQPVLMVGVVGLLVIVGVSRFIK